MGFPEDRFIAPSDSDKVFRVVKTGDWWLPVKEIANNLPHQGTSFIGREREIDDVKDMPGQTRLVTLLGMGYQLLVGFVTGLYRRRWLPFSFEELGMAALTTGIAGFLVMLTGYAVHGHPQGPVIWFTASAKPWA